MRRGRPLARRTSLRATTPLPRGGPMARSAALTRTTQARKRQRVPRTPDEVRARRLVTQRSGGRCEGCGREPATDWAHRVGRAQLGPWCPSNGLHLGSRCHRWSHANVTAARSVGWVLRSTSDPLTTPALLPVHGWVLLDADGSATPTETSAA